MDHQVKELLKLDRRLVKAAGKIKILSNLSWAPEHQERFLDGWRKGNPTLPSPRYPTLNFSSAKSTLRQVIKEADSKLPLASYLRSTARSFFQAAEMLESLGTKRFVALSRELYGSPDDPIGFGPLTNLAAAQNFIESTEEMKDSTRLQAEDYCILPDTVAAELRHKLDQMFTDHHVEVVIDDTLAAKAAAGAKRVRIRSSTCFSRFDIPQLLQHECFVHTLTLLNGREQPALRSLGMGAPRTLRTQEGLAVLAELITNAIDLGRLRRIALRVKAVSMGLQGADFIDVFRFFLESGQNERESFQSTARIFRGGDVRGRIVFTKDIIYLQGLIDVTLFLRKSIEQGRHGFPERLFCGRLAVSDVLMLDDYFESGLIIPPRYQPEWVVNRPCLIAFLMYTNYLSLIPLAQFTLEQFCEVSRAA